MTGNFLYMKYLITYRVSRKLLQASSIWHYLLTCLFARSDDILPIQWGRKFFKLYRLSTSIAINPPYVHSSKESNELWKHAFRKILLLQLSDNFAKLINDLKNVCVEHLEKNFSSNTQSTKSFLLPFASHFYGFSINFSEGFPCSTWSMVMVWDASVFNIICGKI